MNLSDKLSLAKEDLISVLMKHDISYSRASVFANKYINEFVENGVWTQSSLDELGVCIGESNKHGDKYDHPIFNDISKTISQYVLTFAERARLELEREGSELSEDEILLRKEDLLALEEMESICPGNLECSVTDEQKELIQVLINGLDPDRFEKVKPTVTKEEIEQFRALGKKFGLTEELIANHIAKTTRGTPTAYVQELISRQSIIDERNSKNLLAINSTNSTRSRGFFKKGMMI